MGLRLRGSDNCSVCPSRLSCRISLWLLNIPFPHVLSKGTRGSMCRIISQGSLKRVLWTP